MSKKLKVWAAYGVAVLFLGVLSLAWPVSMPVEDGASRVLLDAHGDLLRVWLDHKGQYRFPSDGNYDSKYRIAVTRFEDQRFLYHPGIDPLAVIRATVANVKHGRVVSGASTLSMQAARLRNPRARTWWAKLVEAHTALRMEWQWGKQRVFAEYASHAPMGGNVVGVETACWRFFGHSSAEMTWAEAAVLALLPNRPSALNLARSREKLLVRRNALLRALYHDGHFGNQELQTALAEPLPDNRSPWRFRAPHYAEAVARTYGGVRLQGTIDPQVQALVERLSWQRGLALRNTSDVNISVLVVETATGKIRAYLGSLGYFDTTAQGMVDGVLARRSTGSTLKPFLYGLAIARGPWTPASMLNDVPIWYGGFSPQNADQTFSGMVPLRSALARSLNVPAVEVLHEYGLEDFHHWLSQAGLQLIRTPEGYGLPLILGGAEASLAELVPLYAMLLNDGARTPLRFVEGDPPTLAPARANAPNDDSLLPPAAAYLVRQMLTDVKRPDIDLYHAWFDRQIPVAWKTGTSYGSRDGWAIGGNAQWTVGVWVGNFRGGSVPGLSGSGTAAPLLFSLLNVLTDRQKPMWPARPSEGNFRFEDICPLSGFQSTDACEHSVGMALPITRRVARNCALHRHMVLSRSTGREVCSRCWNVIDTVHRNIVVWPAAVRNQWRLRGSEPPPEPLHEASCPLRGGGQAPFSWVYPAPGTRLFLPWGTAQEEAGFIARVAHRRNDARLYWFLDGVPLGQTVADHQLAVQASTGSHELVVVDSTGLERRTRFTVRKYDGT